MRALKSLQGPAPARSGGSARVSYGVALKPWRPDLRLKRTVRVWFAVFRKGTTLRSAWVSAAKGHPRHCVDRKGRTVAVLPRWVERYRRRTR